MKRTTAEKGESGGREVDGVIVGVRMFCTVLSSMNDDEVT